MQGSAAVLAGPGHVLAAAASLPAAVAAWLFGRRAAAVWVAATLLLAVLVKPEEAMVYGLSTAPVGLGAGWGLRQNRRWLATACLAGGLLAPGLLLMAYGIGFAPLGPGVGRLGAAAVAVYLLFAFLWGGLWAWITPLALRRLRPVLEPYRHSNVSP